MDWSDEREQRSSVSCSFTPDAMECDEHICPRHSFSCGDGQCVDWITRMVFQRFVPAQNDCFNKRNLNFMCEVSEHRRAWTLPNGLCWPDKGYDDPQNPPWNMMNMSTLTDDEKCEYLLRCALSDGFERDCPCNSRNCTKLMTDVCPHNSVVVYPSTALINPNVLFYYDYDVSEEKLKIDGLIFRGSQRCRGFEFKLNNSIRVPYSYAAIMYSRINNLCSLSEYSVGYKDYLSNLQFDKFCYNNSLTFNGRPYAVNLDICDHSTECISQYRIHDGFVDCLTGDDEYLVFDKDYCTGKVGQHRFRCFNDQYKCLPPSRIGTGISDCSNNYDEMWYGRGTPLKEGIKCQKSDTVDCDRLKKYIGQSATKNASLNGHSQQQTSINQMPFRSYCDSFWDLHNHTDELSSPCQHWVCQRHQYQCRTGQCIELDWVCDGEWDCSDASDEEAIFLIEHQSMHNVRLVGLNAAVQKCSKRYLYSPFSSICNTSIEFGCYLSQVSDPLNITKNRPCIKLTQIGDGHEDCYNAYDEKNVLEANLSTNSMLGFHLRCGNHYEPYASACLPDAKNNCTTVLCSNHRSEDGSCSGIHDVMCLDGRCVKNARCNGMFDCQSGEDEYWCAPGTLDNQLEYRHTKKMSNRPNNLNLIQQFPLEIVLPVSHQMQFPQLVVNSRNNDAYIMHSYLCNRGVAVLQADTIVCLCPPAYYGNKCEFYSDRISIIAHMEQNTSLTTTLRIKATLRFEDIIIDDHEFTIIPAAENLKKIKHRFYLLYSRSVQMLRHKQMRYFNRTDVSNNHPYSVHFDVFSLENDNRLTELGSWHYPIYFDYLPTYRLAVVLKFPSSVLNNTINPCLQNPCNQNSICLPVFNQNNSYYCSCKSGFYGKYCELYNNRCESYCSANALCRNNPGDLQPYCICPLNHFGPRCNLKHTDCDSNPCLNAETCLPTNDQSGEASYMCVCSKRFYGSRCQNELSSAHIDLNMTNTSNVRAAVIQFYDIATPSFQLIIRHQQVYKVVPSNVTYYHSDVSAPSLGVLKVYENLTYTEYFIVYSLAQKLIINITSIPQHCPHVSSLLSNSEF
jgi:hypothetical protein